MTYKQYLIFNRRLRRVKAVVHAVGYVVSIIGLAMLMIGFSIADSPSLWPMFWMISAGLGLVALGSLAGFVR